MSRASNNRGSTYVWKEGGFEVISDNCSNCGKTKKEIRKAWKDGVPLDKEVRKKSGSS
ncbi:MAG: hypothetical protein K5798_03555 [Nitrosopumilus sp.]|uniref:hypothetical protein n=1 Tax=Nitrosopumilus sp. TaxID=2024843 RepID=UPI00242DF0DD|nr:hypothetical protein [Nitrosopumilus sp.]MCV0366328.1 hypothetical protein [Nitrosopumilus sp.]